MSKAYVKLGNFPIRSVLEQVFTRWKREQLHFEGYTYKDPKWISQSGNVFWVKQNGKFVSYYVPMGSHRYQNFLYNGTVCMECGIKGKYFTLEYQKHQNPKKPHFNLYGTNFRGEEIMLTKDHIIPRSLGGKNIIDNYQTLCSICNGRKGNKWPL